MYSDGRAVSGASRNDGTTRSCRLRLTGGGGGGGGSGGGGAAAPAAEEKKEEEEEEEIDMGGGMDMFGGGEKVISCFFSASVSVWVWVLPVTLKTVPLSARYRPKSAVLL